MSVLAALIARDLRRAWTGGGALLPVAFFLLVATLFPFALGSEAALLARVGGGAIWTAALLAALLPVERLVAPDLADGTVDQFAVRGLSATMIALAKTAAHWLAFAPPLLGASVVAAALFGLSAAQSGAVLLGLAIGTPGLAALAVAVAALTAGLRGAGALAGLLLLPLAVPLLVFGAGALVQAPGALPLLGAVSLLLCVGGPPVAGAAIRLADA